MAIVRLDGGKKYAGELKNRDLIDWFKYGLKHNQKYLYKGFNKLGRTICVFSKKKWSKKEIEDAQRYGFLGIREYKLINVRRLR